jgi:hypothetical protein
MVGKECTATRREVLNSNEHSFGPTLDVKPYSWLLLRAAYKRYLRDAHEYDAGRAIVYQTGETAEDIRLDRLAALRKVDEAARTRNKLSIFTQISPLENLTFHGGFDFTNDEYPRSDIGTQKDINYSPSVGFVYAPLAWASFFGDYNWERFDWRMRAMQRDNVVQTPESDPDRVWGSRGKDRIHTFSVGTDLKLIGKPVGTAPPVWLFLWGEFSSRKRQHMRRLYSRHGLSLNNESLARIACALYLRDPQKC